MTFKFRQISAAALLLISINILGGCGDNTETKSAVPNSTVTGPVLSPLDPTYEATLAQGIEFKKPGYPTFLAEVSGMSGREDWGRWTDANAGPVARFRFKQPLPEKFTLEISANAFGPNEGDATTVRVGTEEKTFVVPRGQSSPGTYSLVFDSNKGGDTVEIVPPKPVSPQELKVSRDSRRVGLGLVSLKIR